MRLNPGMFDHVDFNPVVKCRRSLEYAHGRPMTAIVAEALWEGPATPEEVRERLGGQRPPSLARIKAALSYLAFKRRIERGRGDSYSLPQK